MVFETEAETRAFIADVGLRDVSAVPTTHDYWTVTGSRNMDRPPMVCSICFQEFWEYPCNAQPINPGQCCAWCDEFIVNAARAALNGRVEKYGHAALDPSNLKDTSGKFPERYPDMDLDARSKSTE